MELTDVLTPAEALSTSRELTIESVLEWEHPYITFVSYALRVSKLPQFNGEQTQLTFMNRGRSTPDHERHCAGV